MAPLLPKPYGEGDHAPHEGESWEIWAVVGGGGYARRWVPLAWAEEHSSAVEDAMGVYGILLPGLLDGLWPAIHRGRVTLPGFP